MGPHLLSATVRFANFLARTFGNSFWPALCGLGQILAFYIGEGLGETSSATQRKLSQTRRGGLQHPEGVVTSRDLRFRGLIPNSLGFHAGS